MFVICDVSRLVLCCILYVLQYTFNILIEEQAEALGKRFNKRAENKYEVRIR
jgi:hypothetical protein